MKVLTYVPTVRDDVKADWINYYDGVFRDLTNGKIISFRVGHKWPVILQLRDFFKPYDYVWFLDDDLEVNTGAFIEYISWFEFEIVQPSLLPVNYSHKHLLKTGRTHRDVPFCEIMAPCIRTDVLMDMDFLGESESGWGLDLLWGKRYKNTVVDYVTMKHTKPVSSGSWIMSNGLTPMQELDNIKRKYAIN